MTSRTITLTGAETRVDYSGGANAWLRNDGSEVIYGAAVPGITAGSDGVVSIPAGQSAPVYGAYGTVYLLGTGAVQLISSDYSTNPFKTSAQSGGSGADSVARAAIISMQATRISTLLRRRSPGGMPRLILSTWTATRQILISMSPPGKGPSGTPRRTSRISRLRFRRTAEMQIQ